MAWALSSDLGAGAAAAEPKYPQDQGPPGPGAGPTSGMSEKDAQVIGDQSSSGFSIGE